MHYLTLIGIGFAVGLIARILMPGRDPMGIFMTTILGIGGSYVGAYGTDYFGIAPQGTWEALGVAIAGALIVLLAYKLIRNV